MSAIKSNIQGALVAQMNREFYSHNIYMSMAAYFESVNLKGFANWMEKQAIEESGHGMRFYNYLVKRGARITIGAMEAPPIEWATPLDAMEQALSHEQMVTDKINELMGVASAEEDYATVEMLQWFIREQVEEEESVGNIIFKVQLASTEKGASLLYAIDEELGKRGKDNSH